MRDIRQRYVLLTVVALAIASTIAVVGCGPGGVPGTTASVPSSNTSASSSPTSAPTTTADTTTATSSTTTVPPTTTTELSSAETLLPNGHIRAMGYIQQVWDAGGVNYLRIDYADMLTGAEADAAAVEAGLIEPGEHVDNDYFIRNVNPLTRDFLVSPSVSITTETYDGVVQRIITWEQFRSFWSPSPPTGAEHMHGMPWWIERDGPQVVKIEEQFLP
ncbi:MAG: hypothetical protein GX536_00990 [Actinobacteria bacterium]|nr:hypothetical protein [Actinomycetota bacterium]